MYLGIVMISLSILFHVLQQYEYEDINIKILHKNIVFKSIILVDYNEHAYILENDCEDKLKYCQMLWDKINVNSTYNVITIGDNIKFNPNLIFYPNYPKIVRIWNTSNTIFNKIND